MTRLGATRVLTLLLAVQCIGIIGGLLRYAVTQQEGMELRVFAVIVTVFGLFTVASVWFRRPWSIWTTLVLVSFKLTIDLFSWTLGYNRVLLLLSLVINAACIFLAFRLASPPSSRVTVPHKIYFLCVLVLAAWVGFWGFVLPAQVETALPFTVPPLHARFLGAMYFSGAAFLALSMRAKTWAEVRAFVPMISIWTGMLGVVSLFHLEAFDWSRRQVWIWFFAYICYPIIAAWIVWTQRLQRDPTSGPAMSVALRTYLYLQGGVATALAWALLFAPDAMTERWPWKITMVLAHIYGAPFLSYGLGSFYAARQRTWGEVRIVVYGTLVFSVLVLVASYAHAQLFKFGTLSTSLWFGGFALSSLALALFGTVPVLRQKTALIETR